ncbi:MAG: hypothetical protein KBG46_07255 [Paracoccus sp.]|nr:hypothetical protein [Paracoccus sp. (in: a-proteobacteria)]
MGDAFIAIREPGRPDRGIRAIAHLARGSDKRLQLHLGRGASQIGVLADHEQRLGGVLFRRPVHITAAICLVGDAEGFQAAGLPRRAIADGAAAIDVEGAFDLFVANGVCLLDIGIKAALHRIAHFARRKTLELHGVVDQTVQHSLRQRRIRSGGPNPCFLSVHPLLKLSQSLLL